MLLNRAKIEPRLADEYTIMTWNVLADCCCTDDEQGFPCVSWASRDPTKRHSLHELELKSARPDIIVLQEVDHACFENIIVNMGKYFVFSSKHENSQHGLLTAVNLDVFEVVENGQIKVPDSTRIFHWVKLKSHDGQDVILVNLHLHAKNQIEKRRKELEYVLRDLRDVSGGILIAGDFNDTPESEIYKNMELSGYRNGTSSPSVSFTTCKTRILENQDYKVKRQIDYIWGFGQIDFLQVLSSNYEIEVPDVGFPSEHYPSDHLSQICSFQLLKSNYQA